MEEDDDEFFKIDITECPTPLHSNATCFALLKL
jgi:hypothetical protein